MGVSKKKRKYIKRNYPQLSCESIADKTGVALKDVKQVLGLADSRRRESSRVRAADQVLEWGILIAVFCAPLVFIPGQRDATNIPQNAFVQVSSLVLALIWCGKAIFEKKICLVRWFLIIPLFGFVVWSLMTLLNVVNLFEGVNVFLQVLSMFLFFLVVMNVYYGRNDFTRLVTALVLSGSVIACLGVSQYLFDFSWVPQARPPAATFTNRNMASQFMVLVVPFGLYLFVKAEKNALKWFAAAATGLMVLFAVYTRSLAAWISIAAELALFLLLFVYLAAAKQHDFQIKARVSAMLVVCAAFLVLINVDSSGFNLRFGGLSDQVAGVKEFVQSDKKERDTSPSAPADRGQKQSTIQWRWSVWLNSLVMIKDNPIAGVGSGNYKIVYPVYNHSIAKDTKFNLQGQLARAHNDYIQAAAEFGIIGFAVILLTIAGFYYSVLSVFRTEEAKQTHLLAAALLSAGTGILLNAGFSFPFQRAIPPFVVMLILGISGVMYARSRKTVPIFVTNARVLYSLAAVVLVVLLFFSNFHYNMIKFDRYMGRAITNYNHGRWEHLLREADKAFEYDIGRKKLLFYQGYASYELGRVQKSIDYYEELIEYFPHYVNGLINLGLSYGSSGFPDCMR